MPMKGSGTPSLAEIDRYGDGDDGGVGWLAYPDEQMQRASHALAVDGEVWVVEPVDAPDLDDLLAEFGEVAGVLVLLDRHKRDAATLANRHDVAVHIPDWMTGVASKLDAPVERLNGRVGETDFEVGKLVDNVFWQEATLWDGSTLVVPESLGGSSYFRADDERVGVHPFARLLPPRRLLRYDPDHLLVGHGAGLHDDVPAAIEDAVSNARSRAPGVYVDIFREFLS